MGTATATQILAVTDAWADVYTNIGNLKSFNANINSQSQIVASGDINLIAAVGKANEAATSQPYQAGNNGRPMGQQYTQLNTWVSAFSGVSGVSTLDAFMSAVNATAPYTYLFSPVTAMQSKMASQNGGGVIPSSATPLVATTNSYMTPANVFAPSVTYGAGTITGTNTATYANNLNLPIANNSIQIITITNASSGTWTYSYNNVVATGLAYNISASALQTAINALSPFATPGVVVTSPSSGVYVVQGVDGFAASLTTAGMQNAVVNGANLVGTGASVTIQNVSSSAWKLRITATGGNYILSLGSATDGLYATANIAFGNTASQIQSALEAILPIGVGNVTVTGSAGTYTVALTGIFANQYFPYDFLTVQQGTLSGGSAVLTQTVIGGIQGYAPPSLTNAVITTTVNGTCVLTVTADVMTSAGVFVSARTFTATLSSATAGTVIALTPGHAGDRITRVTGVAVAGAATAGVFNLVSVVDRVVA